MKDKGGASAGTGLIGGFAVSDRRALLVGRAHEMHELEDALRAVRDKGKPRAVTVLGAAGIGKTRLVRDFLIKMRTHGDRAPRVFRGSARDHDSAYGVFARVLRARFGIVEGMDREAAKAQVRAQVAQVLEDRKVGDLLYFLGQLLELEFFDSPLVRAVEADPQQVPLLRRTIIKSFLEADVAHPATPAAAGAPPAAPPPPMVLVFDDVHWAADESLDLLAYLIEHLKAPILVLCLARPELMARRDGWLRHGDARHALLELPPLSETDAAAAMHDLLTPCGEDPAVDELIEAACNMAGGNPALLEQMVRIFLDTGVLEAVDELADEERWRVHVDHLSKARLPLTVEDAVQARLAALAPKARDLLERAATMGGVFWLGGLVAIHRLDQPTPPLWSVGQPNDVEQIRELLRDLVDRDYILRLPDSTFSDDDEYVFKHNLEREALVRLTPPAVARRFHAAIADWLSFRANVRTHEEYVAMLARHREKSGARSQAAAAYLEAADVARSRYANAKAAEYYSLGLAILSSRSGEKGDHRAERGERGADRGSDKADRGLDKGERAVEADPEQRLRALHHYGDVLQSLGRSDDALKTFREMLTRAFRLDQKAKGGAAHSRIGRLFRETGRIDEAAQHLDAALALFEAAGDERGIASTVDDIGKLHWMRGDYPHALAFTKRALVMRRRIGDRRSIALSLNNLGLVHQDSGQFAQALEAFEQALAIRREIGDLVGVSITLNNLGTVAQDQRDDGRALELFEEAYSVARETGDRNRISLVLTNLGETHNRLGDPARAIILLRQAEEIADELGDQMGLAEALRGLGKAYLAQREYTKARECTARAVEIFTETKSRVHVAVALRSLGEVTASGSAGGDGLKSARGYLTRSIAIFEELGNAVELARSYRAFADMLRAAPDYQTDPNVIREASMYSKKSDEIFARLKMSVSGLEAETFFAQR